MPCVESVATEARTNQPTERDLHGESHGKPPTGVAAKVKPYNPISRRDQALDPEDKENMPQGAPPRSRYDGTAWRRDIQRQQEVQRRRKESRVGSREQRNKEKRTFKHGSIRPPKDQKTHPPSRDAIDEDYHYYLIKGILIMVSQRLDIWIQSNRKAQKRLKDKEIEHNLHTKGGEQA